MRSAHAADHRERDDGDADDGHPARRAETQGAGAEHGEGGGGVSAAQAHAPRPGGHEHRAGGEPELGARKRRNESVRTNWLCSDN